MKSHIWHLAGISLLCAGISAQALAGDGAPRDQIRGNAGAQQRDQPNASQQMQMQQRDNQQQIQQQRGAERQQQQQMRDVDRQQQQQIQQQQNQQRQAERQQQQQIRDVDRQQQQQVQQQQLQERQAERQQQQQIQQQQNQQRQVDRQQLQQRQDNLPIQSGPGEARQTQPPRQGYYNDNGYRGNGSRGNGGNYRPNDRWTGRPDGHGNGWGPGPQYRPGHVFDQVPGSYSRVPYRGLDYFYSDGYWYRPQGPRYVVVTPPYGVRVRSLPAYSQEVWVGGSLFFVAAGTYYAYRDDTQDYEVAYPPQPVEPANTPQQAASQYDPVAYPARGQSAEQVAQDKYDCYRWSVDQSSFDPADPSSPNAPAMIQVYRRSMMACLMDRGYTIN